METTNHFDDEMMNTIENKVHVLQNIQISPSKTTTPQQQLNELYPNLKLSKVRTKFKLKDSDDVYLFRIPKSVDVHNLLDLDINLEQKCKVKIGREKFVIRPTSKIPDPTLVHSNKTGVLHFKSNIVMEKYVKAIKDPHIPVVEKSDIPLPNNLKNRHPIFGSNFEQKIQLDEVVEKKLDDAIQNLLKQSKKKSKKIKQEKMSLVNSTLLPDISTVIGFNLNVSSISHKKRLKKEKHNSTDNNESNNSDIFNVSSISPKKRLKKEKHNSTDDNESNNSDIFGISDYVNGKKLKIKREPSESREMFSIESEIKKIKKRKVKEEPEEVSPSKKKKKTSKSDVE